MLNAIRSVALLALLAISQVCSAQTSPGYDQFVVAEDVVVRWVNGEQRFCQRLNLKGNICGQHSKIGGKRFFEVMDWWHADTFVKAYTGLQNVEVLRIEPGRDGSSLVIYFKNAL